MRSSPAVLAVGGDEPRGEHPPRGERHVLPEHHEHRGLERVGAAGHPQVRPGPHERPEHGVVGQCRHPRRRVGVEPQPAAADRGGRGNGIRLALGARSTGLPTTPGGSVTVSVVAAPGARPEQPAVAARAVGEHLDLVEPGHGVRHEERPQRGQVDERSEVTR